MTERTEAQIARMKRQTFGVEIECNDITRGKAAETAAGFFGTGDCRSTGVRSGQETWRVWDAQGREWKFQRDSSIRGADDQKCEVISPVLRYEDLELLQELARQLRHAGAKSSPSRGCGLHIHVGLKSEAGDHDARTLRNLVNIMAAHEEQIGRAICLDENRMQRYCRAVDPDFLRAINSVRPRTMEELADCWYRGNDADENRHFHYNRSRYHMLNLHSAFTIGTVEFRQFQFSEPHDGRRGGLHAGELKAYIHLCLGMSELAKELHYASPRPQQTENERYAFRCWMLRLGFIGEEFRTTRRLLLKNMEGNAAWRLGSGGADSY